MAIAAIVLQVLNGSMEGVLSSLHAMPETVSAAQGADDRIAATMETPAHKLLASLESAKKLPGVIDLELIYVNYEDDMDGSGFIDCGPIAEIYGKLKKS